MGRRKDRPLAIRILGALCSTAMLCTFVYILIAGFSMAAGVALAVAVVGIATPVMVAGGGFVEMIVSFFEALLEGVLAIFEFIGDLFSSLSP